MRYGKRITPFLDILVQREGENPAQPWLTVILDDYSRAVGGYFLFFEAPSAAQTALALRQAIWRKDDPNWHVCEIPDVLYTDNGRLHLKTSRTSRSGFENAASIFDPGNSEGTWPDRAVLLNNFGHAPLRTPRL